MKMTLALAAVALAVAGCGTTAESEADTIARNVPANYRAAAAAYLRNTLTDLDSVRDPEISSVTVGRFNSLSLVPAECIRMITRGVFGGDAIKLGLVTFENGAAVDLIGGNNHPPQCQNRRYEPFPEIAIAAAQCPRATWSNSFLPVPARA